MIIRSRLRKVAGSSSASAQLARQRLFDVFENSPSSYIRKCACFGTVSMLLSLRSSSGDQALSPEVRWNKCMEELRAFRLEHGHSAVPKEYPRSKELGSWVNRLRVYRKQGKLALDKVKELEEEDFVWDAQHASFQEKLDALKKFRDEFGHCAVTSDCKVKGLYSWVVITRNFYHKFQAGEKTFGLTQSKIDALNGLGFIWDAQDAQWKTKLEELQQFKAKYGHTKVPINYDGDIALGNWVNLQRKLYKEFHSDSGMKHLGYMITQERIDLLNKEGFVWDVHEEAWIKSFEELLAFKETHGHIRVSSKNSKLYGWLMRQRKAYLKYQNGAKSPMTEKRKRLLETHFRFGP
mmetsp:Transcript_26277/g.40722  ORF Transcript_26277/g.40722 Transcript_26277/m.40722 type:complete len:350 (-) Transcript_26277:182-1231(-)|eukprot:CAMPEP_0196812318 /NCGR_PEP_ID=MMETSP1362-20130617/24460_1 /TAXON_ID=163516 /ORGANISM="Leptocylindrus danicus, Strain CCMP1856" /LENGTH=349 /DNA_ID=CAMNT_0042187893 /DNA_START=149 /DNA_END=1201 /DNA_ORIENTATION=-